MFCKIQKVRGDIVECGVGKTRTFAWLAFLLKEEDTGRTLWGFDSFEGFPKPSPEDASPRNPQKGEWAIINRDMVFEILKYAGLDDSFIARQIKIVKGFFTDTLPQADIPPPIALLHLDVDLYNSYKICLEELFPRISRGGIVLFDEYASLNFPGAKKAIDEYFAKTPYRIQKDEVLNKYYVIKDGYARID